MNPNLNNERRIQTPFVDGVIIFHGVSLRLSTVVTFLRIRQENKWKSTVSCCRSFRNRALLACHPKAKEIPRSQRQRILQRAIDAAKIAAEQTPRLFMDDTLPVSFVTEMLVSQRDNTTNLVLRCLNFYMMMLVREYYPNNSFVDYVPYAVRKEVIESAIDLVISDSLAGIDRTCCI
jgi:hypothetical protein